MKADEYQELALRTANEHYKEKRLPSALSLAGESGEYIDLIKKILYHNVSEEKSAELEAKIIDELGDIAWSLAVACHSNGLTLSQVMKANIEKLQKRHGIKYSSAYINGVEIKRCGECGVSQNDGKNHHLEDCTRRLP